MAFYLAYGGYTYYPGQPLRFILTAPPGGTAYVNICGFGSISLEAPLRGTQYTTTIAVPQFANGLICTPVAYYTNIFGHRTALSLGRPILFARRITPTPKPAPKPTPTPRVTATPIPTPKPHQGKPAP